jgi:DnaJ family protein C protein 28
VGRPAPNFQNIWMSIITSSALSHARRFPPPRVFSLTSSPRRYKHRGSASGKLFEDAKREEQEEKETTKRREQTLNALLTRQGGRNWDGEEPVADAVLRMLVDKYKPLRSGTIRSADEKLSKAAPIVRTGGIPSSSLLSPSESTREEPLTPSDRPLTYPKVDPSKPLKDQPLLPAVEGHRPWHTNFTPPSHATASIRPGNFKSANSGPSPVLDEKARKLEKEKKRRFQTAFKLEGAKESVLDHQLGVERKQRTQANPLTMKGWVSLVEQRIEVSPTVCSDIPQPHFICALL